MHRLTLSTVLLTAGLGTASAVDLETLYLDRLDAWVAGGGKVEVLQTDVVESCGKLAYLELPLGKIYNLNPQEREDMDFRVDVCSKLTVNRVHPQPEFENPESKRIICGSLATQHPVFAKLCSRAHVTP